MSIPELVAALRAAPGDREACAELVTALEAADAPTYAPDTLPPWLATLVWFGGFRDTLKDARAACTATYGAVVVCRDAGRVAVALAADHVEREQATVPALLAPDLPGAPLVTYRTSAGWRTLLLLRRAGV